MSEHRTGLIEDATGARLALDPIRRQLLEALQVPGSAASLAQALDMPRQKIGYHLKTLEAAGLITLVETRQRRGFTERVFQARADAFVVDPAIMGGAQPDAVTAQDRYAAGHLVAQAAGVVRDVTRMQASADAEGTRLLTFTIEADLRFAAPGDIERFTTALSEAVATLAGQFAPPEGGRPYRLLIGGHPTMPKSNPTRN